MGVQSHVNQRNNGGGEPLEVNRGGGEEWLDAHVIKAAPDGTRKTMPGFSWTPAKTSRFDTSRAIHSGH